MRVLTGGGHCGGDRSAPPQWHDLAGETQPPNFSVSRKRIASRWLAMICACQMSATESSPIRNTQSARARFVCDSAAGRRRVRTNQAIEKSPSTASSAWLCSRCKARGENQDIGAIVVPWPRQAAAFPSGCKNTHLPCVTTTCETSKRDAKTGRRPRSGNGVSFLCGRSQKIVTAPRRIKSYGYYRSD